MIFGTVDLIVSAIVVISVIFAFYRGLLRELLGISGWILAGLGAVWSYEPFLKFFTNRVEKVQIWTNGRGSFPLRSGGKETGDDPGGLL